MFHIPRPLQRAQAPDSAHLLRGIQNIKWFRTEALMIPSSNE